MRNVNIEEKLLIIICYARWKNVQSLEYLAHPNPQS